MKVASLCGRDVSFRFVGMGGVRYIMPHAGRSKAHRHANPVGSSCRRWPDMTRQTEGKMSEPAADKPTLGQVSVNRDVFDLDLRINDSYQAYSAELLLSLSGIRALYFPCCIFAVRRGALEVPGSCVRRQNRFQCGPTVYFLTTGHYRTFRPLHRILSNLCCACPRARDNSSRSACEL